MSEVTKARASLAAALYILGEEVSRYADMYLPNRTPSSAFLKMFEEMGELVADPKDPSEWADVFIMLLDLAHMHMVTPMLVTEIFKKLEVNAKSEFVATSNSVVSKRTKELPREHLFIFNGGPDGGTTLRGVEAALRAATRPRMGQIAGWYEMSSPYQFDWVGDKYNED